ncbi:SGT1 protein-domain-containing protein [Chaetomium sp. MPI-CAGE-AT-0009]|nr:SGT1 protein-domain-containing protein [Chaetomium sp. MPI-CAGE-AT-0009]
MDTATEPRPGDDDFDGFRMSVSEDYAEYMLFVIGDKADSSLPSLEAVRKAADRKLDELAKDYIWQREPFKLEAKTQKGLGLPYLHGITHYGDNVEDEWLIVYLLRELSKAFPQLWIRVSDSDGEFLLIEAAKVTPKWLSPENDANRVWIHDGKLLIIPLADSTTTAASKPLSLPEAIRTIKTSPPPTLIHSPLVEAESFYRLEKYPAQITAALHHSVVTIPRKLAYILHARPKAVAPATEAFYLRDPRALKPLLSPSASASAKEGEGALTFPPTDLVTVSVRFSRVLYAQLKSQRFAPPPAWGPPMRAAEAKAAVAVSAAADVGAGEAARALARLEMGMKLTTGSELLARTAEQSASRVVREVALLLEDLAEDGGDSALPTDGEIARWEGVGREDDDGWMDVDFRDFERELEGKKAVGGGFGDEAAQADLRKIVSRFEAFLNDESAGIEGAETEEMDRDDDDSDEEEESDDDEDREVSFDEEQFGRMMREMMGLPAEDGGGEKGKAKAVEEEADEQDEQEESEDEEIRKLTEQMESELKKFGALELDPKPNTTASIKEKGEGSIKKNEEEGAESSDEAIDIDYNLAKNLLESFKSQAGMAGPAGNILGMMGMALPRDEEDSGDE